MIALEFGDGLAILAGEFMRSMALAQAGFSLRIAWLLPGVTAKAGDVHDAEDLVALLAGHDAVISSVHFVASDPRKLIDVA